MQLVTKLKEKVNIESPLSGHPDPYWRRESFVSLNGKWEFEQNSEQSLPSNYSETIVVPFAVETSLSGINRRVSKGDFLHYKKEVLIPDGYVGKCAILRFMASDQETTVYIN